MEVVPPGLARDGGRSLRATASWHAGCAGPPAMPRPLRCLPLLCLSLSAIAQDPPASDCAALSAQNVGCIVVRP